MVGHTALGTQQSNLISPASLHGREGSSFPDGSPPSDTVDSKFVVRVKPDDSGVVIRLMNLLAPCQQSNSLFTYLSWFHG